MGELLRYEPFGDARGTQPSSDITDRGFTGHRENRDIGLTYMNARYYVGEIGRFASADTLVPDPQNPQSFNRYGYGYNNPVKYKDPTGHYVVDHSGAVYDCSGNFDCQTTAEIGNSGNYLRPCHHSSECVYPQGNEHAGGLILADPYDAAILGASGNVREGALGPVGYNATVGVELLLNFRTRQITSFLVVGGGVNASSAGASGNLLFYTGGAGNLEEGNHLYGGNFATASATGSVGPVSASAGRAWVPGDNPWDPQEPYSDFVGVGPGSGFSAGYAESHYVPLITNHLDSGLTTFDAGPYLLDRWKEIQATAVSEWNSFVTDPTSWFWSH